MKQHVKLYEDYLGGYFKTKAGVKHWLDDRGIKNYTINEDLTVDVDGDVDLKGYQLTHLPVQFGEVQSTFQINLNHLTTLKGCPKYVGGYFYCDDNNLTSLEGCPTYIGGDFHCDYNKLKELRYGPDRVGGDYVCSNNELTDLVGLPLHTLNSDLNCQNNKLTTLEGIPQLVKGKIHCQGNKLESLLFAPKKPWNYYDNPCTKIYDRLDFTIEAHIESLLKFCKYPSHYITNLERDFPERYEELLKKSRELRFKLELEDEELTNTYNKVSDIEKGYF